MKVLLAPIADMHIGSTVGLCPPTVLLDDEGTYQASKQQVWLWECWNRHWDHVRKMGQEQEAPIWVVSDGDIFENVHHHTTQLWSTNPADWYRAAYQALELVPHDLLFVVRGTETHSGPSGYLEEKIANDLGAYKNNDLGTHSWWTLDLNVAGVNFNIAHRGPMGRLPWTRANALNRLAYEIVDESIRLGYPLPNVVLRAHNHVAEENSARAYVRVFSLPAWQLRTAYVDSRGLPRVADVGGMTFVCEDGEWEYETKIYNPAPAAPLRPTT